MKTFEPILGQSFYKDWIIKISDGVEIKIKNSPKSYSVCMATFLRRIKPELIPKDDQPLHVTEITETNIK